MDLAVAWIDWLGYSRQVTGQYFAYEIYTKLPTYALQYVDKIPNTPDAVARVGDIIKGLKLWDVLSEEEYVRLIEYDVPIFFEVETGAAAVLHAIESIDFPKQLCPISKSELNL